SRPRFLLRTRLNEPRLRVLSLVNPLESCEAERQRTHRNDVDVEQTGAILRRKYFVLVPQQGGTQVAPQLLVPHLLNAEVPQQRRPVNDFSPREDSPAIAKKAYGRVPPPPRSCRGDEADSSGYDTYLRPF